MLSHQFIFSPGEWLGQGKVSFSASPEILKFYTKWIISPIVNGQILCTQQVEKVGIDEPITNAYCISHIEESSFKIALENNVVGLVHGVGAISPTTIAWEFHDRVAFNGSEGFEGTEIYLLKPNGEYTLYAEYFIDKEIRTFIDGRIWRKA